MNLGERSRSCVSLIELPGQNVTEWKSRPANSDLPSLGANIPLNDVSQAQGAALISRRPPKSGLQVGVEGSQPLHSAPFLTSQIPDTWPTAGTASNASSLWSGHLPASALQDARA